MYAHVPTPFFKIRIALDRHSAALAVVPIKLFIIVT